MIKLINESIETPAYALSKGMQYKGFDGNIVEVLDILHKDYDTITVRIKDKNGRISTEKYKNDYIFYVTKIPKSKSTTSTNSKVKLVGTVMRGNDIVDYSFSAKVSNTKELNKLARDKYGKSARLVDVREVK